jgi:hypothetical protein
MTATAPTSIRAIIIAAVPPPPIPSETDMPLLDIFSCHFQFVEGYGSGYAYIYIQVDSYPYIKISLSTVFEKRTLFLAF